MITDHWNSNTVRFLGPQLAKARELIRIATGFFTIQGYDLIRSHLVSKRVKLMVGYDEASKERLREKLIDDIMVHLRLWDVANRRDAVLDLVGKLQRGELEIIEQGPVELIEARLRNRDHAKIYIIDDSCVVIGSSNLTVGGLRLNVEGVGIIDEPERVADWVQQFEKYWTSSDTYNLTQELLEALLRWLELRPPYEVYLKTLNALVAEDTTEAPRETYKMPVKYQMVVIERVLRQLREWKGAMLVASTGLGKTIMATHAAHRLRLQGKIVNVLVFAPKQVLPDWEYALYSAGLSYKTFTRNLLDRQGSRGREMSRLTQILSLVDDQHLIIVDESQYFRNQLRAQDGAERRSFERLAEAVRKGARVILLTATPLTKDVEDLNNQLRLLPHTAEPSYVTSAGQYVLPGLGDHKVDAPRAWRVRDGEDFFEEFINLPVCTVISTSQVAKNFAVHTEEGDYVQFGDERRWLPQILIRKLTVPVPFEEAMSYALTYGYFKHEGKTFQTRGQWHWSESTIHNLAEVSWTSSPLALKDVLRGTINGAYAVDFLRSDKERAAILGPILNQIESMSYEQDTKLMALVALLKELDRKAIIFTERLPTAAYLALALAKMLPELRIACAVTETEAGYELKDFDDVFDMIVGFAPQANVDNVEPGRKYKPYDLFISTDAYGAGVNLQDASVVISYDLAWTADVIIQRAGRILRFWKQPRRVELYVFVGNFQESKEGQRHSRGVIRRLDRLGERSQQAEKFSELPLWPRAESVEITSLGEYSSVQIEDLGLVDAAEIEEFSGVSHFLLHITELNQNLAYASSIPDDISSAMTSSGTRHQLYLLLRYQGVFHWMLYDIATRQLSTPSEDQLLDLIQCEMDTPLSGGVDADTIEREAQKCRNLWMGTHGIPVSDEVERVERICALYLLPEADETGLGEMLAKQVRV
jgi:hypothetical protein